MSESTLVPISLVIIFFGFVFWLTGLYFETKANTGSIVELRTDQKSSNEKLSEIIERLSRIEGKIDAGTKP